MVYQGVTEEDLEIVLERTLAEKFGSTQPGLTNSDKLNELRDTLDWARRARKREDERENQIRKTMRYILIMAAAYALFQGARYYLMNGLEPVPQKPAKIGAIYAPAIPARNPPA